MNKRLLWPIFVHFGSQDRSLTLEMYIYWHIQNGSSPSNFGHTGSTYSTMNLSSKPIFWDDYSRLNTKNPVKLSRRFLTKIVGHSRLIFWPLLSKNWADCSRPTIVGSTSQKRFSKIQKNIDYFGPTKVEPNICLRSSRPFSKNIDFGVVNTLFTSLFLFSH